MVQLVKSYFFAKMLTLVGVSVSLCLPMHSVAAERFDPATCTLKDAKLAGKPGIMPDMRLVLRDGKNGFKAINPSGAVLSTTKNGYTSSWKDASGKVKYTCKVVKTDSKIDWMLYVKNSSKEDLWLDVRLQAATPSNALSFWDGRELHSDISKKTERTTFVNTFPMTCAWDSKSGVAIGINPQQIVSCLEEGCDPEQGALWQGVRMIVWAGKTEDISISVMSFIPDYGYFSALQVFYDAFPVSMSAYPGTDNRLKGGYVGGIVSYQLKDKYLAPEFSTQEFARRSYNEWDWYFRPAKYNMFVFDRPEYWQGDDKPYSPPDGIMGVDVPGWKGGSEREYNIAHHRYLTERGEKGGVGSMYYILSHGDKPLVEKYNWLANNEYAKEDNFDGFPTVGDWGGLPGRGTRRLFPGAGPVAQTLKKDMVEVLKTYSVRGFAWDSNRVDAKFRQPNLIREIRRVAFDEKGPYVQDAAGYSTIIDYVHTLKLPDGVTAGMASNLGPPRQSYLISLHSDTSISEMLVVHFINDVEGFEHDRIMRGRRSKTQLSGMWRDPVGNSLNWAGMSPIEIREALRALHSQFLLLCLKLGIFPEPDSCYGYEKTMRHLPAIDAATTAGWEPVSAMKGTDELWFSRFGKGAGTILTVGNPMDGVDVSSAEVKLDNGYTGLSGCVLAEFFGKPMTSRIDKAVTAFNVSLADGDPLVCRVAGTVSAPAGLQTTTEYRADRIVYNWKAVTPVKAACVAFAPQGMKAQSVTAGGRSVAFKSDKNGAAFNADLAAGQSVKVTFVSETIRVPQEKLFGFPFVNSTFDAASCAIVLPASPTKAHQYAASRIQESFRFYCVWQNDWDPAVPAEKEVLIPVVSESDASGYAYKVHIGGSAQGVSASADAKTLYIGKMSNQDEAAVTNTLLRALDARYPFTGKISSHLAKALIRGYYNARTKQTYRDTYSGKNYPSTREMLKKAGVLYGVLTEKEASK